ncbi:TlpA family protein disulfide reductase [Natronocalculus amylovorans]|uniref:TlpA family protein disulfide reductase n=1 Tax=Natronocalculus amylovorans TaxID=2917812 RepID=A0AAE3FZA4_9EURY|nr:TlpA disulfide reductase family protein [Natronocalculus amylovorans]MCL9818071.1 TlpA family protein disulfide reductase [Natronocalculus amylovorans]
MNRRQLLAGMIGATTVGGGWLWTQRSDRGGEKRLEPTAVETIDATGSTSGTVEIPTMDSPVLLEFFATWCDECREFMPTLADVHASHGDRVTFISVTTEPVGFSIEESDVQDWWESHEGSWTVGIDPRLTLSEKLDVTSVPTTVLIDRDGTIRGQKTSAQNERELEAFLEPVL